MRRLILRWNANFVVLFSSKQLIMRKVTGLFVLLMSGFVMLSSFALTPPAKPGVKYPKKVNAVIQNKCYGCHNAQGKNEKAKTALNWDDLASATSGQGDKLKSIEAVLEKGSMPPARFLEGNPDKKLTDAETALMKKWAGKVGKKFMK